MIRVLFVCLGNICRSPMAEGIFIHKVKAAGLSDKFEIDSCGTGNWHVGEQPDFRARRSSAARGTPLLSRARQLRKQDFEDFDYILAMDEANLRDLAEVRRHSPTAKAEVLKMRVFDPQGPHEDVPDPYYGDAEGFERVYDMLDRAADHLLAHLIRVHHLQPAL